MCQSAPRVLGQLPLVLFCSLVSIATGTLCIALVALYHQEEAVLIVIACSTILYGFLSLPLSILLKKNHWEILLLKFFSVLCQLTILGAAIEYFNYTTKHEMKIETYVHKNLLIGLDSLLLCSFLINGFALGYPREPIDNSPNIEKLGPHKPKPFYEKIDEYIPLKNSAQTLTPEMDALRNMQQVPRRNVNSERCSDLAARLEERISNSSVVQHRSHRSLPVNFPGPVTAKKEENSKIRKIPKLKGAMKNNLKSAYIFRFISSKGKIKKVRKSFRKTRNPNPSIRKHVGEPMMTGGHRCRLPTISDYSHSRLNSNVTSRNLTPLNRGGSKVDPLHREKASKSFLFTIEPKTNVSQEMNSELVPPCLEISDPLHNTPPPLPPLPSSDLPFHVLTPVTPCASVDDSIEKNGLEDIPQVPQLLDETTSNFLVEQEGLGIDIPMNVTSETWEKNKENLFKGADYFQRKSDNIWGKDENLHLLPAVAFDNDKQVSNTDISDYLRGNNFSFPLQKPVEIQNKFENKDDDTISALEEYFKDVGRDEKRESHIIKDGLHYDNNSYLVQCPRFSRDSHISNGRHSPTKSIISIISGRESLGANQRSQTILMNNSIGGDYSYSPVRSSPVRSSPTRSQRLKRMGKKLSLSNISDTVINTAGDSENNNDNDYKCHLKGGHIKGKSIDFSYIHSLQSNNSPSKSLSGLSPHVSIYRNRRSSIATDDGFNLTADKLDVNTNIGVNTNEQHCTNARIVLSGRLREDVIPSQNRASSTESSQISATTSTNYPDIVMSEYDRERWNVLLNLRMVNSRGQYKAR